ncbi:MAG: hypothetical protein Q8K91_08860 [Hylemonella sp.]|nr:hypothetical protein [Hylemonella sp.]MDP1937299.1 hypothetical protein [Hylemonella sp.]
MLQTNQILVRALTLVGLAAIAGSLSTALSGCGQPGVLYLPTEPAAARRATLPETLIPGSRQDSAAPRPAAPASAPASK